MRSPRPSRRVSRSSTLQAWLAPLALLALATSLAAPAAAFRLLGNTQTQSILYPRPLPSEQPPFLHWDLREFANAQVPYSFRDGTADIAGLAEFTAIDNAFQTWENVTPAAIRFVNVVAPAGSLPPGNFDGSNIIGWVNGFGSGISGDDQWLVAAASQVCGANVGANTPIIGAGADGWLTTLANNCIDDRCLYAPASCACGAGPFTPNIAMIAPGVNGALETTPNNCDVWDGAIAPANQVCNALVGVNAVIIRAGPDGVLNTVPNNCPGGGDDMIAGVGPNAVIHAGANGRVNTIIGDDVVAGGFINNGPDGVVQTRILGGDDQYNSAGQITAGADGIVNTVPSGNIAPFTFALTPVFYDLNTGRILESDIIINDLYTWQITAQGATMGGNPDVQMVQTHEIGHFLGLHHPTDANCNDVLVNPPGAAFNAIMSAFTYITDDQWLVPAASRVCNALVGANAPIISPGLNGVLENALNNCGAADDAVNPANNQITAGGNGRVNTLIQADICNQQLAADDMDGINFLYSPDLGDADDPFQGGPFNRYQTRVQSPAAGPRMLNGIALRAPALGPVHLFSWQGAGPTGNSQFEWIGRILDNANLEEFSPFLPNQDPSDDGVTFPPTPFIRGTSVNWTVLLRYSNQPGRYSATVNTDQPATAAPNQGCFSRIAPGGVIINDGGDGLETTPNNCSFCACPGVVCDDVVNGNQIRDGGDGFVQTVVPRLRRQQLYFNGYFDFDGDGRFDPTDIQIYWAGIPGTTTLQSPNTTSVNFDALNRTIELNFLVPIPLTAADEFMTRCRLDYGEDEARVTSVSGDLRAAEGVAQFGEVEDDRITTVEPPVAALLARFEAEPVEAGVELRWQWADPQQVRSSTIERGEAESGPWAGLAVEPRDESGVLVALDGTGQSGRTYYYRLVASTVDGRNLTFGPLSAAAGGAVTEFALREAWPNPSAGTTQVEYSVARESEVRLSVVDVNGREVTTLASGVHPPGRYLVAWDGSSDRGRVPSGVYFLRYDSPGKSFVRRVAIVW